MTDTKNVPEANVPSNEFTHFGHSHESKLFADVIASHNEIVASLESHNRELLAVIAAKDEAITKLAAHAIYDDASVNSIAKLRSDAIAIKPGDIALYDVTQDSLTALANAIIEECAKVAEEYDAGYGSEHRMRDLKVKE